jgi:integrase/recombinase XerD
MKKLFRAKPFTSWENLEKEVVDEIIFRTTKTRNRLMLEFMARGGMRIGEVLKFTPNDINDRKLIIRDPKSGKELEIVFAPQKVADRLKDYIRQKAIQPYQRIFPICYEAARAMVKKAGEMVGVRLSPHDLRRFAATYASRCGVPVEIISKVIFRHA